VGGEIGSEVAANFATVAATSQEDGWWLGSSVGRALH
jgi:hypothetical protein